MGGSELGEGWLDLGLGLTYSRRTQMHRGAHRIPNMNQAQTSSRIYTLNATAGIWRGLSLKTTFPLLDVTAKDAEHGTVREWAIGDMPLVASYLFSSGTMPRDWTFTVGAGAYLPTGSSLKTDIPSNPNFVSGTVDPIATLAGSYDFMPHFGLLAHAFSRIIVAENTDGYRAGNSFLYGAGARIRYFGTFVVAAVVNALHRLEDRHDGVEEGMTGGDWIFFAPSIGYLFTKGAMTGLSLMLSAQIPVYQRLNGRQLAENFNATLQLGYGFNVFGE